jgi:hypothetical protein
MSTDPVAQHRFPSRGPALVHPGWRQRYNNNKHCGGRRIHIGLNVGHPYLNCPLAARGGRFSCITNELRAGVDASFSGG